MKKDVKTHSFRTAILALVLGSLALTVGVIGVVAFINSSRSVEEMRQRQYELTSRLMSKEVTGLLAAAPRLLRAQAALAERGILNLEDFDRLGITFAESLRVEPELSWLSYGAADTGAFVGARRDEHGRIVINRSDPRVDGGRPRESFVSDDGSLVPLPARELPSFDARARPWFKDAARSRKPVWSSIYQWNDGVLGMTLSLAARSPTTEEVVGVFTADYTLGAIDEFLRSIAGEGAARVLILATPDGQLMGEASTIRGAASVGPILAALPMAPGDLKLDTPVGFNLEFGGHPMIAVARRIEPTPGFACVAIFAADEKEFFGSVRKNARSTGILGLTALLSAAVISFLLAARLTRPLAVISDDLQRIARFDLQKQAPLPSLVREIAIVGESVERMKAGLRSFGRYVPTTLVRNLLSQGHDAQIGAVDRELTIVFADLAGFTSISEKLSPAQTVDEMSEFFQLATEAIEGHQGTLDKFLGDGLLAFFNAPLDVPDHAVQACTAALEIRDRLTAAEAARAAHDRPQLRARFGINTGEVLVGNIGTDERFAYTVIGDNANLASRLEGLNKQYGTVILASEAVRRATGDHFAWRQIDRVAVVGRSEATTVHELLSLQGDVGPAQIALRNDYEAAMEFYYKGDFTGALRRLKAVLIAYPEDPPTRALVTRCAALMEEPPENWTGVFVAERK
jgi:adenylate cyclase